MMSVFFFSFHSAPFPPPPFPLHLSFPSYADPPRPMFGVCVFPCAVVCPDAFCARRYRSACRSIPRVSRLSLSLSLALALASWLWRARTRDADRLVRGPAVLATQNMEASGVVPKAQEIEFKALEGSLSMMSKGARIRVFRPGCFFFFWLMVHG